MAELRSEVRCIRGRSQVGRAAEFDLRLGTAPVLVFQPRGPQPYRFVESGDKTVRVRNREECGALMGNQPMSVDHELVPLGLSSEDGVIIKHQAGFARSRQLLEDQRRGQTADSA